MILCFTVLLLPIYSLRVKLMYMWGKLLSDIILESQFKQLVEYGFQYDNWEAMEYNFTSHGTRKNPSNTFLNFTIMNDSDFSQEILHIHIEGE